MFNIKGKTPRETTPHNVILTIKRRKDLRGLAHGSWIKDSNANRVGGLIKLNKDMWQLRNGKIITTAQVELPCTYEPINE